MKKINSEQSKLQSYILGNYIHKGQKHSVWSQFQFLFFCVATEAVQIFTRDQS